MNDNPVNARLRYCQDRMNRAAEANVAAGHRPGGVTPGTRVQTPLARGRGESVGNG